MWIFAYGSLIFRPAFEFVERRRAYVEGFARRFWQGSPDHRGTARHPGRVVTLVADETAFCGGVAYRIAEETAPGVLAALDARERAGFDRKMLALWDEPKLGTPFGEGLTYVAQATNPHYLGPLDESEIAEWIFRSKGPSGPNSEYANLLRQSLVDLEIADPHVEAIFDALARLSADGRSTVEGELPNGRAFCSST